MAPSARNSTSDRLAAELALRNTVRAADPAIRKSVAALRDGMTGAAVGRLSDGLTVAADALRELVNSTDEHVHRRAAVIGVRTATSGEPADF